MNYFLNFFSWRNWFSDNYVREDKLIPDTYNDKYSCKLNCIISSSLVNQLAILIYLAKPQKYPPTVPQTNLLSLATCYPLASHCHICALREDLPSQIFPSPSRVPRDRLPSRARQVLPAFLSSTHDENSAVYIQRSRRGFLVFHHRDAVAVGLHLHASHESRGSSFPLRVARYAPSTIC